MASRRIPTEALLLDKQGWTSCLEGASKGLGESDFRHVRSNVMNTSTNANYIERYVAAVARELPASLRGDVENELRSH
jgi:hypothetical protein